jgi:hypothetical protein
LPHVCWEFAACLHRICCVFTANFPHVYIKWSWLWY